MCEIEIWSSTPQNIFSKPEPRKTAYFYKWLSDYLVFTFVPHFHTTSCLCGTAAFRVVLDYGESPSVATVASFLVPGSQELSSSCLQVCWVKSISVVFNSLFSCF